MKPVVRRAIAVVGLAALSAGCASSTTDPATSSTSAAPATSTTTAEVGAATPVLASVVAAPVPVPTTDGKVHLAYELQLVNAMGFDVTLTSLAVKSGDQAAADARR